MLRVDQGTKALEAADSSTLNKENILERSDLQVAIVNSWEAFTNELGVPSLFFVDQEVTPHPSCSDRIDILAFDEDAGKAVVIEIKRDKHKLQLLQGLSYAAMLSHWGPDEFEAQLGDDPDAGLLNSIRNIDPNHSPRIVLIAERFEPEVILTADLLFQQHDVDIQCFQLTSDRINDDLFLSIQAHYPPPGLDDLYRSRARPTSTTKSSSQTWDDVKDWIEYEWGRELIDYLRSLKDGDPGRRTFAAMFPGEGRGSPHIKFQKAEIRVDIFGRKDDDLELWRGMLPSVAVNDWGQSDTVQGLTFKLPSPSQAAEFLGAVGGDPSAVKPSLDADEVTNDNNISASAVSAASTTT